MQFHLNGFRPGDPAVLSDESAAADGTIPSDIDVLIVGCGPAGLTLAAQLAAFPDISTCIVEQLEGPLQRGRADGIACRTMEMFNAFGFADRLLREAYWVNETTFWKPDRQQPEHIARHGRVQDVEDGLSEFPHVILNQARVHDFYLELMQRSVHSLTPHYARQLTALTTDVNIFDLRSIDRTQGAMVLVRPDQHIAHVLPLTSHHALAEFFAGFLIERQVS